MGCKIYDILQCTPFKHKGRVQRIKGRSMVAIKLVSGCEMVRVNSVDRKVDEVQPVRCTAHDIAAVSGIVPEVPAHHAQAPAVYFVDPKSKVWFYVKKKKINKKKRRRK